MSTRIITVRIGPAFRAALLDANPHVAGIIKAGKHVHHLDTDDRAAMRALWYATDRTWEHRDNYIRHKAGALRAQLQPYKLDAITEG